MGKSGKDFSPNSIRNINDDWGNDSRNNLPYSGQAVQTFLKNLLTSLSNYANLSGKPKVNNVELSGNKSLADLGITYSNIKPATGVPKSDLASDVQASLGKADTALQSVPNTYRTASDQDVIDSTKQPKTDNTLATSSKQVAGAINEVNTKAGQNASDIDAIEGKIPAQATSQNQLADKAFVNSSVQTATANFRGNWNNWASVPTASSSYPEDYTGSKTPTTNDYLVVVDMLTYFKTADEIKQLFPPSTYFFPNGTCCTYNGYVWKSADTGFINVYPSVDSALWTRLFAEADLVNTVYALAIVVNGKVYPYDGKLWAAHDVPAGSAWSAYNPTTHPECFTEKPHQYEGTWRFKYTGVWATNGKAGWQTEYQVNEKPLTAAQLAAINSGITTEKVALIPTSQEKAAWNAKQSATDNALQTTSKQIVGAINENKGRIDNISTVGRFLSVWDCQTGLPQDNPASYPYPYKSGDFFVIGSPATKPVYLDITLTGASSTTRVWYTGREDPISESRLIYGGIYYVPWNVAVGDEVKDEDNLETLGTVSAIPTFVYHRIPSGTQYTGAASTAIEVYDFHVGDIYKYTSTGWLYLPMSSKEISWGQIGGLLSNQTDLQNALNAKQPKTDNSLQTTSKQIVGAINEVNGKVAENTLYYTITEVDDEKVISQTAAQKALNIPVYQKIIAGTINRVKVVGSWSVEGMATYNYEGYSYYAAEDSGTLAIEANGIIDTNSWSLSVIINASTYEIEEDSDTGIYENPLQSKEDLVTTLDSSSDNYHYPAAKTVYDSLALKEDKTFYVDFTQDPDTEQWSANKTLAEIADAVNAGKVVMGRRVSEGPAGDVIVDCPLIMSMIGDDGGNVFFGTTYSTNFGMAYITFMVSNEGGGSSDVVLAYEGNADNLFITKPSSSGTNGQVLTTNGSGTYTWTNKTEVVNDTTHTDTNKALSANMGKELQTQVNNLKNIGRFLAIWDASTGSPTSEPTTSPYTYKVGDYYRVGVAGTKNPASNLTYVTGGTNWQTGDALEIGDVVYCSNVTASATTWVRQASSGGGAVQDVQVGGVSVLSSGIANVPIATSSANGAMSSTDKSKLDGIESGADVTDATNVAAAGAVMTTAQSLTTEQKTQARSNIGAGTPIAIQILEGGDV